MCSGQRYLSEDGFRVLPLLMVTFYVLLNLHDAVNIQAFKLTSLEKNKQNKAIAT